MKFLLDENGEAFNTEFVERIYATRIYDRTHIDENHGAQMTNFFYVGAEISGGEDRILEEFKSDDEAENFKAAKKYFTELVDILKEKTTFIFEESKRGVTNIKFIKRIGIEQMFSGDSEMACVLAQTTEDHEGEGSVLKEFTEEDDEDFFLDSKDYLADLVKNLNSKKINFIVYEDGEAAINISFIKNLLIERMIFQDSELTCVVAELSDKDDEIILQEFDSGDEEKDLEDAKIYLADLMKNLNEKA
ncbi:MAG: hypothetical protein IJT73_08160 [Selenomonadaceae bacterium]|nr:hypothetical protein [Selenomonadaceae bacterium]